MRVVKRAVGKVQASVARCLRTPPYAARRKGLDFGLVTAYAATATGARLSFAIVLFGPVRWHPAETKLTPLDVRRSYFGPMIPKRRIFGGAAGYRPRVRSAYYERVYVHSSCEHQEYNLALWAAQVQPNETERLSRVEFRLTFITKGLKILLKLPVSGLCHAHTFKPMAKTAIQKSPKKTIHRRRVGPWRRMRYARISAQPAQR